MNFIIQKDEYFSTLFVDPGPSFVNATNITNISDSVIKFQNIIIDSATFVPEPVPTGNDLPLGIQKKLFLDDFDDQLKLIDSNGNIEFTSFDQNLNTNSAVEFQLLATPESFIDTITQQARTSDPAAPPCPNCIILYTKESNTPGKPDLFYRTSDGTIVDLSSQATNNPFDQNLNTADNVTFNIVKTSQIQPADPIVNPNIIINATPTGSVQILGQALECSTLRGIGGISGSAVADATINNINPTTQTSQIGDINPYTEIHTNNLFTSNIKGNGTSSLNIDDFSNIDLNSFGDVEFTGKITGTELEVTNNIKVVAGNIEVVTGSITAVGAGANIVGYGLTTTTNGLNVAGGNIAITGGGSIGTNSNTSDIGTSSQPFACIFAKNINLNDLPDFPGIPGQLYKDSNSFVKIS